MAVWKSAELVPPLKIDLLDVGAELCAAEHQRRILLQLDHIVEGAGAMHDRVGVDVKEVAAGTAVHGVDAGSIVGDEDVGAAAAGQRVGAALADQIAAAGTRRQRIVAGAAVEIDEIGIGAGNGDRIGAAVGDKLLDMLILRAADLHGDAGREFDHLVESAVAMHMSLAPT